LNQHGHIQFYHLNGQLLVTGEDWQAVSEAASDLVENTAQALEQAASRMTCRFNVAIG
jgi:hypothetical protein